MTSACCSSITIYPKLPFLMHTQQIYTLQNHLHFFLLMYHNHICNLRQLPINFKWSTASLINHFSRIFWFFQFAFFLYLKRTKENFNLTSKIHWSNGTFQSVKKKRLLREIHFGAVVLGVVVLLLVSRKIFKSEYCFARDIVK